MLTFTFQCQNEAPFIALQRAAHVLAAMHPLAQATPSSQILHTLEGHALDSGPQLLRDGLPSAAQQRLDQDEKKGTPPAAARTPGRTDARAGMAVTG